MRTLLGNIATKTVPFRIKNKKNSLKGWDYGYNEQWDIVVISKDGTIGEIYEINGLKIALPSVPKDKTKIINSCRQRNR